MRQKKFATSSTTTLNFYCFFQRQKYWVCLHPCCSTFLQVLILQAGGRLALNRSLPYENPPHLLMSNLEPRHTYYIQVAAFNSRGSGPFSETLEVRPEPSLAHLGAVAGIAEDKGIAWITPLIIGTKYPYHSFFRYLLMPFRYFSRFCCRCCLDRHCRPHLRQKSCCHQRHCP